MILLLSILINTLWAGAIAAFAAWFVLRVARHANATTRYLVWTCALLATVALAVATGIALNGANSVASAPIPAHGYILPVKDVPVTHTAPVPHASQPILAARQRMEVLVPKIAARVALGAWAAVTLWLIVRFCFALAALEKLKRNATPLPIEYRTQLLRWNATDRGHTAVRLCVSDDILVPVAVGLFDAMILIPQPLLERLEPDDVDRILLHEFAHLRRHDDWIHAFQRIVGILLFFNPIVALIGRQMDLEREVSCDDSVLEGDGLQPIPYATCLTKMAEIVAWPYAPLAAPGVFNTRRSLSVRVERLLTTARDNRTRIAAVPALAALLAIGVAGIAAAAVSPAIRFALPAISVRTHAAAAVPKPVAKTAQKHVALATSLSAPAMAPTVAPTAVPTAVPAKAAKAIAVATAKPQAKAKAKATVAPAAPRRASSAGDDYIQELASEGYTGLSIDDLVQMKAVGVDADYIRSLQQAGFDHPSPRELVETRATGVTPDYISDMRRRFGSISLRHLVELHSVGVTAQYIDELSGAGYSNLTPNQLLQMRALGIDADYIRKAEAHGFHNLTVQKLIELKATGLL